MDRRCSKRLEGNQIGQPEVLIERKADGAGQGELVLREVVLRGDQALLLVLVVHLGAEHVEAGAGAGVVGGYCLIERDLRGCEFGIDGFDAGCVCDAEQIGIADGEDDEVARIFGGELGALRSCASRRCSSCSAETLTRFWVR